MSQWRRRAALFCSTVAVGSGVLSAQPTIAGPAQGSPGQVLSFQLMDGAGAVPADAWQQGFNPDRYAGNDYATSFRLQITPQPDGSVQLVAPAPGRYRLWAFKGTAAIETAVLIRPQTASPPIRGVAFFLSADGESSSVVREEASERLAVMKNMGISWLEISDIGCMDLDSPTFAVSNDPTTCYSIAQTDLEWLLDEAHQQGYKIALEPAMQAQLNGSGLEDLQEYFSQLTETQMLGVQVAYAQYELQAAIVAQQHNVEALFVGSNWQVKSTVSAATLASMNTQWNSVLDQVRAAYSGQVWMGWANDACDQWSSFQSWSRVDAIHFLDRLQGSGMNCFFNFPNDGIFNITAQDMVPNLLNRADLPGFQLQSSTGLPAIWGDYYPIPYDGTNFYQGGSTPWNDLPILDDQEMVDFFEAKLQSNVSSPLAPTGLFAWATELHTYDRQDLLSSPAFVHAAANWFLGDTDYFEPCLVTPPNGVLFQSNFNCPLGRYALLRHYGADVEPDPQDPANNILTTQGEQYAELPDQFLPTGPDSWSNFVLTEMVRLRSNIGSANTDFRIPLTGPYAAYDLVLDASSLSLSKYVNDSTAVLGTYSISGGTVNQWFNIGLTAIGPNLTVSLNGTVVIAVQDTSGALLSGLTTWSACCSGQDAIADFDSILVSTPPAAQTPGAPVIQGVTNAASYLPGTVAPGEIVTLFGSNLGPSSLAGLQLDGSGEISSSLGGTSVLFSGVAAPLLYSSAGQVAAIVPFEVSASTNLQVQFQGLASAAASLAVSSSAPGIFTTGSGQGQAAAINLDGTINSSSNPAKRGTYLTLFLTGQGQLSPSGIDGAIAGNSPPVPVQPVSVQIGSLPASVTYAGIAPFSTNGLLQLNIAIPTDAPMGATVPILVTIGNYVSQPGVTVSIQ
jgi:uncharacterized protein (TIGR03437 family)